MAEAVPQRFNPETGKPNPVSLREVMLMDRKEGKAFVKPLNKKEEWDFQVAVQSAALKMPLIERREVAKEFVAKLQKRENKSIGDKLEVGLAKLQLARLMLPEKQPIFFRKLRTKELKLPKWMTEKKSAYLMGTSGV
jgi:hypothetical protein